MVRWKAARVTRQQDAIPKTSSRWRQALVVVVVLAVAAGSWWWSQDDSSGTTTAVAGTSVSEALQQLATLTVAVEDTGNPYKREDWPHWAGQGASCDTREIALQRQGSDVQTDGECRAVSGVWISSYDGVTMTDAGDADLDHVVPLAEAARSGTRGWTKDQRRTFANDLDQLLVVTARSNQLESA